MFLWVDRLLHNTDQHNMGSVQKGVTYRAYSTCHADWKGLVHCEGAPSDEGEGGLAGAAGEGGPELGGELLLRTHIHLHRRGQGGHTSNDKQNNLKLIHI